jgi:single-strand DNA-binding protein
LLSCARRTVASRNPELCANHNLTSGGVGAFLRPTPAAICEAIIQKEPLMAGSVNKVILVGNLGRDPEIRTLNSGDRVANLRLATSETWRDKSSGERKEKTEWHQVVIFNENLVKVAESYLKKGSTVYIEGALQTRKWTDQQGAEKYSTEIVLQKFRGELTMLGGRGGGVGESEESMGAGDYSQGGAASGGFGGGRARPSQGAKESFAADLDDDIPFIRSDLESMSVDRHRRR